MRSSAASKPLSFSTARCSTRCCSICFPSSAPALCSAADPPRRTMMSERRMTSLRERMHRLAPGIAAGTSLGISDVLAKIVLVSGIDVVSMLSFRSLVGLAFVATWFRFGRRPTANVQVRVISMIVGIVFAGLIFCLFKAIESIDVSPAILSYFTYPLLTGLTAAFAGLEPLRWKGMLCAIVAFCGLALLIDAHPAGFALAGVAYAIGAAGCPTGVFLVERAYLLGLRRRPDT